MSENKILVSKEILDFLTGIYYEKDKEDIASRKEKIFNRAFNMAYKDMATHTVAYKKDREEYSKYIEGQNTRVGNNKKEIRKAIKRYIKVWFTNNEADSYNLIELQKINSPDAFNEWHKNLCDAIVIINCEIEQLQAKDETFHTINISDVLCHVDKNIQPLHVFTYGQAQKLVNMMLKYLYIYYDCEGWNDLDKLVAYFHVPIDSYVLKAAALENYKDMSWSKINCYEEYKRCQEEIQTFARKKYQNAFEWELTEWPFLGPIKTEKI